MIFNKEEDYILRTLRIIVKPFIPIFTFLTPNQITLLSLLFYVFAGVLIVFEMFVLSGVFVLIGFLLDILDGEVARLTNKVSQLGRWLDPFVDLIGHLFLLVCLSISINSLLPIILICIMYMGERLYTERINEKEIKEKVCFFHISGLTYGAGVTRAIIIIGLIMNQPYMMIVFYTSITSLLVLMGIIKKVIVLNEI